MSSSVQKITAERMLANSVSEPSSDEVNVVFASDANYLSYTAVTLASILKNYSGKRKLNVYILTDAILKDEILENILSLRQIHEFAFEQIVVDVEKFRNIKTSEGISLATYYRMAMHNLLPPAVEKVLYLDSDIIVQGDIDALFSIPFDGALLAGVEDSISSIYKKKFGVPAHGSHVNAGVLLVNVALMRKIGFDDLVERYLEANRYRITLGDQQILGEVFYGHIKYLPIRWNVHGSMFEPDWVDRTVGNSNEMDRQEAFEAIRHPGAIHYTLKRKPWISLEHPKSTTWFEYLDLTPFRYSIEVPGPEVAVAERAASAAPVVKKRAKAKKKKKPLSAVIRRFFQKQIPGTFKSIVALRETRLAVSQHATKLDEVKRTVSDLSGLLNTSVRKNGTLNDSESIFSILPAVMLKSILRERAETAPKTFNAEQAFRSLASNLLILSNIDRKNVDGGYAENIKTIAKTNRIDFFLDRVPDVVLLLSQRIKQDMFWHCIKTAFLYEKPIFFCEVALFGAFASYFDPDATLDERRALGFMVDDLGYYFDARQPSRMERILNDEAFTLTEDQRRRARQLIDKICAEKITKYNKYVDFNPTASPIESGSVLIIDQKRGDASIEFAGATDESFHRMLQDAVQDNPGKTIYFKRHPDSIQRDVNSYRNRKIKEIIVLPDEVTIDSVIDSCDSIYTVSSQVGFEGLLRGKKVVTYGMPFYSGWGLTEDRCKPPRRSQQRTIEDIFHTACIDLSVYIDTDTGQIIQLEDTLQKIHDMRADLRNREAAQRA